MLRAAAQRPVRGDGEIFPRQRRDAAQLIAKLMAGIFLDEETYGGIAQSTVTDPGYVAAQPARGLGVACILSIEPFRPKSP